MADKFVLLLEFSSGLIEPLPISNEWLTQDRIVIIIDELKERVWLWQGAETSLVERRAAQRKARSLRSAGYQLGPLKIGRNLDRVDVVDGEILDDAENKQAYDQLIHTLSQSFTVTDEVLGRFSGPLTATPTSTQSAPPQVPAPSAPATPIQPTSTSTEELTSSASPATETVAPKPSRAIKDIGIIRVGILLATILEFFPLCYINTKKSNEGTQYSIEDTDGLLCEIEVSQDMVHFLKRYDFRGKRKEILSLLRDRLDSASL